jgi:hypothetical protein
MQITVADLKEYLDSYDDEAVVKFATESICGYTKVSDYGFISESTEEVYGKEIVIHPYKYANSPA